ncbi:hypothetical protein [Brevibacterium salitolerans]|uniref:Multidrug resistance protein MdtA-like C-terminal permuted SH3 domain-containing protein n=1 Tax=Brevibacterium salitolerans TaxID=1403566 RepID=A0ABP5I5Y0_9MICO
MQIFRRVILPIAYLLVLVVIAVSLAWLAFRPNADAGASEEFPTGELLGTETMVERGTIESRLTASGTITVVDPVPVKATHSGTVNHIWAAPGQEVLQGAQLFQIQVEGEEPPAEDSAGESNAGGAEGGEEAADAAPAPRARPSYHTVVAPADGTVDSFSLEVGDEVAKGDEALTLSKRDYSAVADIPPVDLYRLETIPEEAEITITGGPAPFDCTGLRLVEAGAPPAGGGGDQGEVDPYTGEMTEPESGGSTQLRCAVPEKVKVYNGLDMTLSVDSGTVEDVLVVPVTAVRGLGEDAVVWTLDENGEPQEREVTMGLSDGVQAEVREGLEEGEMILEYVPGTEPEDDMGFGEEEMMW